MLLAGKKIVVVGGSSGIGLATAELAKREGADVIVASRNVERLDKVAEKLNAIAIPADVTSDDSVARIVSRLRPGRSCRGHGGAASHRSVQDGGDGRRAGHDGEQVLGRLARGAIGGNPPRRITDAGFRLSSVRPRPNSAIVSAANGALESLSRALALELAPVRVNCVSPGIIDTPIRAAMPEAARRDMLAKTAAALPVGRVGIGEDIARQICLSWRTALRRDRSSISMAAHW